MAFQIVRADVIEYLTGYQGEPFHAALFDPPYHLTSIVERFGNGEPEHTKTARDIAARSTPMGRHAAGFMGKSWDGGDLIFRAETWAAIASALYPGAFVMAYCGSRGWHRQAVAMEDGGYLFHPSIFLFGMAYSSGMVKPTRLDTKVAEDEAATWEDHRYGLGVLAPALEPILVGQKPYTQKSKIFSIVETRAGALNIGNGMIVKGNHVARAGSSWGKAAGVNPGWKRPSHANYQPKPAHNKGRWPKNLILHHSVSCTLGECASGCAVKVVGEQSGIRKGGGRIVEHESSTTRNTYGEFKA